MLQLPKETVAKVLHREMEKEEEAEETEEEDGEIEAGVEKANKMVMVATEMRNGPIGPKNDRKARDYPMV